METRRDKTTAAGTKAAISGPLRAELVAHGFVDADAVEVEPAPAPANE